MYPNNAHLSKWRDTAILRYHTNNGFIFPGRWKPLPSLQEISCDVQCWNLPSQVMDLLFPLFPAVNLERAALALCAGMKVTACNAEHHCMWWRTEVLSQERWVPDCAETLLPLMGWLCWFSAFSQPSCTFCYISKFKTLKITTRKTTPKMTTTPRTTTTEMMTTLETMTLKTTPMTTTTTPETTTLETTTWKTEKQKNKRLQNKEQKNIKHNTSYQSKRYYLNYKQKKTKQCMG
ncbi:unnamed protein product [Ranitomeya imitator]|uniref:Uncharacterized protein n=1 Tax=Ranitomeya imitator TaxID=111125 RepID=A0ABN9LCK3_9NEOB|nr:unnamed protein product [Ranitomeya imitator]